MNLKKISFLALSSLFFFSCSNQEINNLPVEDTSLQALSRSASFSEIKVATYNTQGALDLATKKNDLATLADAIKALNPDVLSLQEVSSKTNLKTFVDKYLSSMKYDIVAKEEGKLAILTKLPVTGTKTEIPTDISKYLLQVELKASDNYKFNMFAGKIPTLASRNNQPADQDKVEKIRQFFKAYEKADRMSNYLWAGDLAGEPDAPEMQGILDPRASGLTFHDVVTEDIGSDKDVYSYNKDNVKKRIDYLMPSGGMFQEYKKNTVQIIKDSKSKVFLKASNHLPIIATFSTEKDITVNKK
ncbi:MAG: endonuclease/exonuclease/phosphatase family protein [Candidatus Sericytochromatia bacterium]